DRIFIPPGYESIQAVFSNEESPPFFLARQDNKTKILDAFGRAIRNENGFDRVIFDKNGIFRVQENNLWGLLNRSSYLLPTYDQISHFTKNIALIKKGEAFGLVNIYTQVLAPPRYKKISIKGNTARLYSHQGPVVYLKLNPQGGIEDKLNVKNLKSFRIKKTNAPAASPEEEWEFDFRPIAPPEAEVTLSSQRDSLSSLENIELGESQDSIRFDNFRWVKRRNRWGLYDDQDSIWIPHQFTELRIYPEIDISLLSYTSISRDRSGNSRFTTYTALANHQTGQLILRPAFHPRINTIIQDFYRGATARQRRYYLKKDGQRLYKAPYLPPKRQKNEPALIYFAEPFDQTGISRFNVKGYPASFRTRAIRQKSDVKGGKWGLMNREGNMLFPPAYDDIWNFDTAGFARVFLNRRQGIIHQSGKEILPPIYGEIQILKLDGKTYFLMSKVKPRVGFVNYQGSVVVPLKFKSARDYQENRVAVEVDSGGWTFSDEQGHLIHPPLFLQVRDFSEGRAAVQTRSGWGYLDTLGQLSIKPRYRSCGDFQEGRAWVLEQGRFGYIDTGGRLQVPAIFKEVKSFEKGMAVVRIPEKKARYGLIDYQGNWILKPKYDEIRAFGEITPGFALIRKAKKWGYIDAKGKEILAPTYKKIYPFKEGRARVSTEHKETWINQQGKEQYARFDRIQAFSQGLAAVKRRFEWAFIDTLGQIQIPFRFSDAGKFYKGLAKVRLAGKIIYIDTQGEVYPKLPPYSIWIDLKYIDHLEAFYDGIAAYQYKGKWGYIHQNGKILLSPRYPKLSPFYQGIAQVRSKKGPFYIDQYGKTYKSLPSYRPWQNRTQPFYQIFTENKKYGFNTPLGFNLVPPRYEYLGNFQEKKAKVSLSAFKGLANAEGEILIPAEYESLQWMGDDIFQLEKDGKILYWHLYKGWIWNP
ncbi:MAG: WG repeat-containing protein, partial [Bacteroidota bacterium]